MLKYKGTRDKFHPKAFHLRCDGVSPSVSLLKTKKGLSIAAYTSAPWDSPEEWTYATDKDAIVLNLTSRLVFPCKDPSKAIQSRYGKGPMFGKQELYFNSEPFNSNNNCWSYLSGPAYGFTPREDGASMLTEETVDKYNSTGSTIVEMEVWQIIYLD